MIDVDNWNNTFTKYPVTVRDKGWVYGVWYCGTSYTPVILHGQYPPGFLKRALALFPTLDHSRLLHCPSGTLTGPGVTLDAVVDKVRKPQHKGLCDNMIFPDNSFDVLLSDPPYTKEDSKKYGCKPWPWKGFMRKAKRVIAPNGYLCVLDTKYPQIKKSEWKLEGLICVVTGAWRATRMFSIMRNLK